MVSLSMLYEYNILIFHTNMRVSNRLLVDIQTKNNVVEDILQTIRHVNLICFYLRSYDYTDVSFLLNCSVFAVKAIEYLYFQVCRERRFFLNFK